MSARIYEITVDASHRIVIPRAIADQFREGLVLTLSISPYNPGFDLPGYNYKPARFVLYNSENERNPTEDELSGKASICSEIIKMDERHRLKIGNHKLVEMLYGEHEIDSLLHFPETEHLELWSFEMYEEYLDSLLEPSKPELTMTS